MTEKWRFPLSESSFYNGFILDANDTIYGGTSYIYAINLNGTMKWAYPTYGIIESTPAIDENGVIYIGTIWSSINYLHAIYSNNGTQKWTYPVGNDIDSSPAIGVDGTIYFGDWNGNVHAVYPNGTRKWIYHTGDVITSSPAIGDDGTIYIGSHDDYVYAFYPNGTVKWRFQTGSWVHSSPTIGPDGTIYIGSDDSYLYALNPNNGQMIWRCPSGGGTWCSPAIDQNGTLYVGTYDMRFRAIYPNGTIKWTYNAPGRIWFGSSAAVSSDGTIFFGTTTQDGGSGSFIALNPDGTERYKNTQATFSTSPAIDADGTVYAYGGYLYAFGRGPLHADAGGSYTGYYNSPTPLYGNIYGGSPPYTVSWDFGDGTHSTQQNPTHNYTDVGIFNATFTVTDSEGNQSTDTTHVTIFSAIAITKPVNGIYLKDTRILPAPIPLIFGKITIQATTIPRPYGITRVEFYIDGNYKVTCDQPPYQWTWSKPSFFIHYITIYAYDTSGERTSTYTFVVKIF